MVSKKDLPPYIEVETRKTDGTYTHDTDEHDPGSVLASLGISASPSLTTRLTQLNIDHLNAHPTKRVIINGIYLGTRTIK